VRIEGVIRWREWRGAPLLFGCISVLFPLYAGCASVLHRLYVRAAAALGEDVQSGCSWSGLLAGSKRCAGPIEKTLRSINPPSFVGSAMSIVKDAARKLTGRILHRA
jgi:hypothetical protein